MCPSNSVCRELAVDPSWSEVHLELLQRKADQMLQRPWMVGHFGCFYQVNVQGLGHLTLAGGCLIFRDS